MAHTPHHLETSETGIEELRPRFYGARFWSAVLNRPPFSWLSQFLIRRILKQQARRVPDQIATVERAATISLDATLQGIVQDVVDVLGYAGAMVATYEQGDMLPVRAIYVDPYVATEEDIHKWEKSISRAAGFPLSITNPEIARVCVYRDADRENLSVRAVRAGGPVTSDELYDLFTPVAPAASRGLVKGIQHALGIQQVIAVPFFLETPSEQGATYELVGNLFAAKRGRISGQDILVLSAFGRQAAAAIGSERQRLQIEIMQSLIFRVQTSLHSEKQILDWIAQGVVSDLGYVGAMVAPHEINSALPVRALYVDPQVATEADIRRWEKAVSEISGKPISLTDPAVARVYVDQPRYAENLSVQAAKAGKPVISAELYDLFRPVVSPEAHSLIAEIQNALGIQQVIAVPFFLETVTREGLTQELVGNLFAATRSVAFKSSEVALLRTFGQQAAAGIRNARLYRKAEERRQAAQMFGKMAFSAATSVHALRNHIGTVHLYLDLIQRLPVAERDRKLADIPRILSCLDKSAAILETLREPWRQVFDDLTDVNSCLHQAVDELLPRETEDSPHINFGLSDGLPQISASPDMLIEAFRVLIKNAFEAIRERGATKGEVDIRSAMGENRNIEVLIQDNGIGIRPEDLNNLFEIGWSTKKSGMGFGLFWTRDYIEGLGGGIEVKSTWKEGTTFYVYLPIAELSEEGTA